MKRYFLGLIAFLVSFLSNAQLISDPFLSIRIDKEMHISKVLSVNSTYDVGSSFLNAPFINAYFFSDSISDKVKSDILKNLQPKNNVGLFLHNDVYYSWQNIDHDKNYYVDLASRIQFGANIGPDVYRLLLLGNKQFAGSTADLGKSEFNEISYQSFQFGYYKNIPTKNGTNLLLGGGISLVSGAALTAIHISNAQLYTSTTGDSVSLRAKWDASLVASNDLVTNVNGLGLALNVFGAYQFKNKDVFRFQISDLGFIDWFNNVNSYKNDKQISFTGLALQAKNGIFSINNTNGTIDSISKQIKGIPDTKSVIKALPFQIRAMYTKQFTTDLSLTGSVCYLKDLMVIPELSVYFSKNFKSWTGIAGLSVLGQGPYGIIAGGSFAFSKHLSLMIGTNHLEGFVPVNGSYGQGWFGRIQWQI